MTHHDAGASLQELKGRLERATEGSRELDAEIMVALRRVPGPLTTWNKLVPQDGCIANRGGYPGTVYCENASSQWYEPPLYTTSIDAAVSLIERVLPEAYPDLVQNYYPSEQDPKGLDRSWCAELSWPPFKDREHVGARHRSAPIALLICLLTALEQKNAR